MMVLNWLFITFVIVVIIQVFYYLFIFFRFAFVKSENPALKNIGISVLVCAKNESENLKRFIPDILNQDYPKFELILIDDDSNDDSLNIMNSFKAEHENVKVVHVKSNDAFWNNKKYPLTLGIKSSSYNFLLFTDADCRPVSNQWIKEMSRHFSNQKTIVIGYGAYKKIRPGFLNFLIRFETVFSAMQYFSFALLGSPYMAVGRNLGYRKEEFFKVNGFTKHMHIPSGDDDLFVNEVASGENTAICFTRNSFTESIPETTFKHWFQQKRRHVSTSNYYKLNHKLILGLFYLSQLLFYSLAILLLVLGFNWKLLIGLILLRYLVVFVGYGQTSKKLKELDTLLLLPILELFLVLMQLVIFISNLTSKRHHWR